jgi:predicted metal-dependent enzyme (double-stranded beta helix superfamily)
VTITTAASPTTSRQLSLAELRATVQHYAERVRAGEYVAQFDPEERWHVRIHQDDDVDVWLISWTTEQGTELHDHGGSSGAFTVVDGTLDEYVWSGPTAEAPGLLVDNLRHEHDTIAFGPHYVHDVRNHREPAAVSVHAYSPPIHAMHFYDASAGELLRWGSNWTDDPEAPAPDRGAS